MIKNLTPHVVRVVAIDSDDVVAVLPPSGDVARVAATFSDPTDLDGIPVRRRTFGAATGLPAPVDGVFLVVSALVALAAWAQGRRDVLCPGDLVRDADGRPVGCRGLTGP